MKGTVIFRLPDSDQIECFQEGEGEDRFVLAPFLKESHATVLKGHIRATSPDIYRSLFKTIQIESPDNESFMNFKDYSVLVEFAKSDIRNGLFDKVVLACKQWIKSQTSAVDVFEALLKHHSGAFVYLAFINHQLMIGASPETLLSKNHQMLRTEALGGTKTKGAYTEKEWLEHRQIQTYISNVLENSGYTFTKEETVSKSAGTVEHLRTAFHIDSKSESEDIQLAGYLHPTSAVCGLPYLPALEFIKKNEGFDRKYYSGYIGVIRSGKCFDLFVNLRCAECFNQGYVLYAGAGINVMSDPTDEWEEINHKMQTIVQWLK